MSADDRGAMNASPQRLNVHLASAQASATYRVMDRVAARRASGASVISLCAGEPDFDTPAHVCEAGIDAIRQGHTRYTQVAGMRALREAVASKFRRENGLDVGWQDTIVCSGGKQVIYNALAATLNEGDEVIVPAPYWVSYPEQVKLLGGVPVFVRGEESREKKTASNRLPSRRARVGARSASRWQYCPGSTGSIARSRGGHRPALDPRAEHPWASNRARNRARQRAP